jgi:hypothetical protein
MNRERGRRSLTLTATNVTSMDHLLSTLANWAEVLPAEDGRRRRPPAGPALSS